MSNTPSLTGGLAERYANALFDLAKEAGSVEAVEADLSGLDTALTNSDALRRLTTSAVFSRDEQGRAMAALLERGGAASLTRNFVGLLARNRRLFALPGMIQAFKDRAARERGEVRATVTSARPMSDEQANELATALSQSLGKSVALDLMVDEGLLGGLVVKVGSRMIDSSIRTKLNNLKIAMKEAG
ncbi:MAG: F0F1 ATP synthase subunit delta [Alphaproteobacteria bacterium]